MKLLVRKKGILLLLLLFTLKCFSQKTNRNFKVEKIGKGHQSIIFIPGFACSGDVWKQTCSVFKNEYVCYTLTLSGFAGVELEGAPICFSEYAAAIVKYIKDTKIEKPILVGHSLGGGLALEIAANYPKLIDKLIVVDALPCLSAMMDVGFKTNPKNNCSNYANYMKGLSDKKFVKMQKQAISRLVKDKEKQKTILNWSLESDRGSFGNLFCDFSNTDLRPKLKNIEVKTLVLLESYFINFTSIIEKQYDDLKNVELAYANKGLHFIMYDDTAWYLNKLKNFLSE